VAEMDLINVQVGDEVMMVDTQTNSENRHRVVEVMGTQARVEDGRIFWKHNGFLVVDFPAGRFRVSHPPNHDSDEDPGTKSLMDLQVGDRVVTPGRYQDWLVVQTVVKTTKAQARLEDGRTFWKKTGLFVGFSDSKMKVRPLSNETQKQVELDRERKNLVVKRGKIISQIRLGMNQMERSSFNRVQLEGLDHLAELINGIVDNFH
jgi:hypothetical protein